MGSLGQVVSDEAPPLSSSHLSGTFFFLCSRDDLQGLAKWNQLWERYRVSSDSGTIAGEKGGYRGKTGTCEKGKRADKQCLSVPVLDKGQASPVRIESNLPLPPPTPHLLHVFFWPEVPLAVPGFPPGSGSREGREWIFTFYLF